MAAQGRVNLIGEQTNYNESLMFIPMAIPMTTVMISRARGDDSVQEGVSHEHSVCNSSHFHGTAHAIVIMTSPSNRYG